jgi:hypothetical protein
LNHLLDDTSLFYFVNARPSIPLCGGGRDLRLAGIHNKEMVKGTMAVPNVRAMANGFGDVALGVVHRIYQ